MLIQIYTQKLGRPYLLYRHNTVFGRLTLDPAGMHCPAGDDAFVSSVLIVVVVNCYRTSSPPRDIDVGILSVGPYVRLWYRVMMYHMYHQSFIHADGRNTATRILPSLWTAWVCACAVWCGCVCQYDKMKTP